MCHMEINAMLEIKASNIVFNETFLLRSGTKQRCPLTPLFLNTVLKFLAYAIRKRKKDTQIGKEDTQMVNEHMEKSSISLAIREMQSKIHNEISLHSYQNG